MAGVSGIGSSASDLQVQFMNLLIAQLQNQNPLEPMDNSQMTSQLAQISSLEQLETINAQLSALTGEESAFGAALTAAEGRYAVSLIGKTLTYTSADGTVAGGCVTGVEQRDGEFVLQVGDQQVSLDAVCQIAE